MFFWVSILTLTFIILLISSLETHILAYAWIKCEKEEDKDCNAVLNTASIVGRGGSIFSDDDRYVRLSLIRRQDDFDLLMQHISKLVSQEELGAKSI